MSPQDSVKLVEQFWETVWNPPYDLDAVDQFVAQDFTLTSAGSDIVSRSAFKEWIAAFQAKINSLRLIPVETFANAEGTRVASRWRIEGTNRGVMGTEANGQPIELTGIAIWEIKDGKLAHNWVERSAFELYQNLQQ